MKIKESKDNISLEKLPGIFLIAAVVSVVIRTVQMFKFIDHGTGFYTGGSALTAVLYIIIGAACLCFIVTSFLSSESKKTDLRLKKNPALIAITAIFSLTFLYDSVNAVGDSLMSMGTANGGSAFQSMMLSGTIPMFFQSVFAFLSAIYFAFLTKSFIKGDTKASNRKILAVAPVGWAGFRMIHRFVEQISYMKVSELLLELVLLALMIMFFMAFAQTASGVYSKEFRWRVTGFGLSAALIAVTVNFSRLIYVFIKGAGALNGKYPFTVTDFLFALFIIVLISNIISEGKTKEIEED